LDHHQGRVYRSSINWRPCGRASRAPTLYRFGTAAPTEPAPRVGGLGRLKKPPSFWGDGEQWKYRPDEHTDRQPRAQPQRPTGPAFIGTESDPEPLQVTRLSPPVP
jgi:hypothetical protein